MKKYIYILLLFTLPATLCAQQSWMYVGPRGFTPGGVLCTSFAFSPGGEPYMAFRDFSDSTKVSVMKYDGTNWVNVGNVGFSQSGTRYINIAFNSSGVAYVGFTDNVGGPSPSTAATVMKYDFLSGLNKESESIFSLNPNPASDLVTLNINKLNSGDMTINIYNSIGKLISSEKLRQNQKQFNTGDLSNGLYVVEIKSKLISEKKKLIIQR